MARSSIARRSIAIHTSNGTDTCAGCLVQPPVCRLLPAAAAERNSAAAKSVEAVGLVLRGAALLQETDPGTAAVSAVGMEGNNRVEVVENRRLVDGAVSPERSVR